MAKPLTLCVILLLVTAGHSDGKTPVTVDSADNRSGWSPQGRINNGRTDRNVHDQTNNSQLDENLSKRANDGQPITNFKGQTNSSQPEESQQYQSNSSQPEESQQYQTNSSQSEESQQYQSNSSQPEESQQYQTNSSQSEESLQLDRRASSLEDQASGRTSLNDENLQPRPETQRNRQDSISINSMTAQPVDDVTDTEINVDKNDGPVKGMYFRTIGGHHTENATTVPPVLPVHWVTHLSTKQPASQRHTTDRAMIYSPQPAPHTTTPVQSSSAVPHTPSGEHEVFFRGTGFCRVDLVACVSLQLHDIVIPLGEDENMQVLWRVPGMSKTTGTDTSTAKDSQFTCRFRVLAKYSRYISAKLYYLQLSGGVQAGLNVTIAGGKKTQHLYQSVGDDITSSMVFPSLSSELIFAFQPSTGGHRGEAGPNNRTLAAADVRFDVILTEQSGYQLEKGHVTSSIHDVTTFAFAPFTHYAHDTDSMFHITETGATTSFPHFDLQESLGCQADRLTLSRLQYTAQGAPVYTSIWSQCGSRYIPPQVYDHPLALHFVSDSSHSRTGFQMLYSIHPLSQLPQQLPSGLFNCSVPHYTDFSLHFHCNLEWECVAGEDEADCPYTSTDCGSGHIHIGNKCYLFLPIRREMTWHDASELCHRQKRRVASVQNMADRDSFLRVRLKKKMSSFYLSLALSDADIRDLFGSGPHLPDDSLASTPGMNDSDRLSLRCAYAPVMTGTHTITAVPCNRSLYADFVLCEQENTTTYRPWLDVQVQQKPEWRTFSQSGVHVNLAECSKSTLKYGVKHSIPVEDGLRLEANLMNSTGMFVCTLRLVGRHNPYIAAVIEKFDVDMYPGQDENEELYTLMIIFSGQSMSQLHHWPNYDKRDFRHPFVVVCNASMIAFHLQSKGGARSIYLRLRVLVTDLPGTAHLTHHRLTSYAGIFSSFAFDGLTRYAHETNADCKLLAEGVVISFPYFDLEDEEGCQTDKLQLSLYQASSFALSSYEAYITEWIKCGRIDISPMVYSTRVFVTFITGSSQAATGFQMLYSLHPLQNLPRQVHKGLFNCSVPAYQYFLWHFRCNLERECVAGEDEADCPYTSDGCGTGHIDAGNKCYLYLNASRQMTWYEASQLCRSHGQRLVSPRTPSEWSTFQTITDYGKKPFGVFVGLSTSPVSMQATYREVWRWEDQTMAFYLKARGQKLSKPTCAYLPPIYRNMLEPIRCGDQIYVHYVLCERDKMSVIDSLMQVRLSDLTHTVWSDSFHQCPQGHVTHSFLLCDFHAQCGMTQHVTSCPLPGGDSLPMFECDSGSWMVHYSLVCDHRQDCPDGSDEKWCQHAPCAPSHKPCKNKQCVLQKDWCDGMWHCVDGSDEDCLQSVRTLVPSVPPPAVVTLDGHGRYDIQALDPIKLCPVTHFRCSPRDYCLPVYLRCNDVFDCPGREDEEQCDRYTCPGFYRCRASSMCVHSQHVCDGVFQCPQQDDEWLCDVTCPQDCRCQGLAFTCNQTFSAQAFPRLRYLDASGTGMRPGDLEQNHYLVRLSLSRCGLTAVDILTLPNLRWLDLGANKLITVNMQTFVGLTNLHVLRLAQNPLTSLVPTGVDTMRLNLHTLDLSLTEVLTLHGQSLAGFPRLTHLNISHGALTTITEQALNATPGLQVLDVRGSPLDNFPQHLLRDLVSIHTVYADNFKLCCPAMLPDGFNPNDCHAPLDEIASCDDLLRSNAYRVSLWFMAAMALVGNAGSFVYRVVQREAAKTGFHTFVSNLCLADLLMGLYLVVIGAADAAYLGEYLWNDKLWRGSAVCQMAGFLSLLSSEMSAFFICLITLDRFVVLRFPFSQVRFHTRSALAASVLAWTGGCLLALVPLLPMTSHWRFYSQTGICIPLPITRTTFKGRAYSFGVMVVFNFVLFVLIALGQLLVFLSVRKNSMTGSRGEQDAIIARRLTTIVLSDFLCWFPIGLLGLLASTGTPVSSELNVGMAIFVLPFNSALNPFLYTFNVLMEKRRKAVEARLLEKLKRQVGSY